MNIHMNPDRIRELTPIVGGAVLIVMMLISAYSSDPTSASERLAKKGDTKLIGASLESDERISEADGIFNETVFGYLVLCGQLNTDLYGNSGSFDPERWKYNSASEIFGDMEEGIDPESKVMVRKGTEITFRDKINGAKYSYDANRTVYCMTAR